MKCMYANNDIAEINIEGIKDEWRKLAQLVLQDSSSIECETLFDHFGYDTIAKTILIRHTQDDLIEVKINNDNQTISIHGTVEKLQRLSRLLLSFAANYSSGHHFHLDFMDSPDLMSVASGEIVLKII